MRESFSVTPDLTQTVGDFSGESGFDKPVADWLMNLNATGDQHGWPDGFKLQLVRQQLVGPAKDWYLGKLAEIKY